MTHSWLTLFSFGKIFQGSRFSLLAALQQARYDISKTFNGMRELWNRDSAT